MWREGTDGYYLWINANWSSFVAKWQQLAAQNLRLVGVHTYDGLWAGIWRSGSDGYYLWANVSEANFLAKWKELAGENLRLVDMIAEPLDSSGLASGSMLAVGDEMMAMAEHAASSDMSGRQMPAPAMSVAIDRGGAATMSAARSAMAATRGAGVGGGASDEAAPAGFGVGGGASDEAAPAGSGLGGGAPDQALAPALAKGAGVGGGPGRQTDGAGQGGGDGATFEEAAVAATGLGEGGGMPASQSDGSADLPAAASRRPAASEMRGRNGGPKPRAGASRH